MIANTHAIRPISVYSVGVVVSLPTKTLHVVRRSLRRKRAPAEVTWSGLPVGASESSTYSTQSQVLKMAEADRGQRFHEGLGPDVSLRSERRACNERLPDIDGKGADKYDEDDDQRADRAKQQPAGVPALEARARDGEVGPVDVEDVQEARPLVVGVRTATLWKNASTNCRRVHRVWMKLGLGLGLRARASGSIQLPCTHLELGHERHRRCELVHAARAQHETIPEHHGV
eukprot:scaffold50455_cov68-Phaeocystis_antarctica.AAC.2